jgi:hypothetical protein
MSAIEKGVIIFLLSLFSSIIGLFIPGYSLISTIVQGVITGGTSLVGTIISETAGAIFGPATRFVSDVLYGLINPSFLNDINEEKIEERKNKIKICDNCGANAQFGFFNAAGERLCRDCFEKLSSKIILSSPIPVRCNKCDARVYEYFLENDKIYCKRCFVKKAENYSEKESHIVLVDESKYLPKYKRSYNPYQIQKYLTGYRKGIYRPDYKKGY